MPPVWKLGEARRLADLAASHHMMAMKPASAFVLPSLPILKSVPPTGDGWIHEVKFDGWRVQLHKDGDQVTVYSRNGSDFTARFPYMRDSLIALPSRSAVMDAELVACGSDGQPDFYALMTRNIDGLCAWCFDIMQIDGRDMRSRALREGRPAAEESR